MNMKSVFIASLFILQSASASAFATNHVCTLHDKSGITYTLFIQNAPNGDADAVSLTDGSHQIIFSGAHVNSGSFKPADGAVMWTVEAEDAGANLDIGYDGQPVPVATKFTVTVIGSVPDVNFPPPGGPAFANLQISQKFNCVSK